MDETNVTAERKRVKTCNFTFRIEVSRKEELLKLAGSKGLSPSDYMRHLIDLQTAGRNAAR